MEFKFITHDNHDAYFNLASEEYLLKQTDGYYFYLWINEPSVIVGVNQNAIEEVNLAYTEQSGVKVVRRLTGGGAVFHDYGNLCYTVIAPYDGTENAYKKFTAPVIEYLNSLGVKAEFSGRNDITVDGQKISGNAQTVHGNRIMHHGTLLFSSDMTGLTKSLNPSKLKMQSKGIKSVRARVTNISEHLKSKITIEEFKEGLKKVFLKNASEYEFTDKDLTAINKLVLDKYSTYKWNIGRSPKAQNEFAFKFPFGIFKLSFDTENGLIWNANISGDFFSYKDINGITVRLNGVKFNREEMKKVFMDIDKYIVGANAEEILNEIFK